MKYFYDFSEEQIVNEAIDVTVSFNDLVKICNVIKTNKNILFFEDITKNNILKAGRQINLLSEYKLIHKESLDIIKIISSNEDTIIKTKDQNTIVVHNFIID